MAAGENFEELILDLCINTILRWLKDYIYHGKIHKFPFRLYERDFHNGMTSNLATLKKSKQIERQGKWVYPCSRNAF